jgi:hypothetical protein
MVSTDICSLRMIARVNNNKEIENSDNSSSMVTTLTHIGINMADNDNDKHSNEYVVGCQSKNYSNAKMRF